MYRSSPFRSTEHELHHVWSMYRSSPFRSTLSRSYITALDMCEVCISCSVSWIAPKMVNWLAPLTPAWAKTSHHSQRESLVSAIVNVPSIAQYLQRFHCRTIFTFLIFQQLFKRLLKNGFMMTPQNWRPFWFSPVCLGIIPNHAFVLHHLINKAGTAIDVLSYK